MTGGIWTREAAARAAAQAGARLPVITAADVRPIDPDRDVWDMWPIATRDGRTAIVAGRSWWFFLAVAHGPDPEARHDAARIHLYSHGSDGWRAHGAAFPEGLTPGTRQWSGSATLDDDGETLTMYFTVAGGPAHFAQRLYAATGRFADGGLSGWSAPVELVRPDGVDYARTDQDAPVDDRIKGFRDPGYVRDPLSGAEHLLFTASAGTPGEVHDGIIGLATRTGAGWQLRPPLVTAIGVNSELERPHVVVRDGRYYLFWSTQAKRFAPGIAAPTGLYAMVADRFEGPWRPVNGSGLVAGNPDVEPAQAYCWWVTGEGSVISFVDYWGLAGTPVGHDLTRRRDRFGGTAAPWFALAFDGDSVRIAQ